MVKLINVFRGDSPVGSMFTQLGQTLFGDNAGAALTRQQALALDRQNTETTNLMSDVAKNGGVQDLGADPVTQAMLIGSGYAPQDFSRIGLMGAATGYGASAPQTTNWTVGAGLPYTNTADAFNLNLDETRRNDDLESADRRYGVDTGAATTQRGQDIESGDRRYNTDQTVGEQQHEFDNGLVQTMTPDGRLVWSTREFSHERDAPVTEEQARGYNFMTLFPQMTPEQQLATLHAEPDLTTVATPGGGAEYVPTVDATGMPAPQSETDVRGGLLGENWNNLPGLTPQQQTVLSADPSATTRTPHNYRSPDGSMFVTYDGVTNAVDGAPLPAGGQIMSTSLTAANADDLTTGTQTSLDAMTLQLTRLDSISNQLVTAVQAAPESSFGIAGNIANLGRGAVTAVANIAALFGVDNLNAGTIREAIAAREPGLSADLLNTLFDPRANEVQVLAGLQIYQAASALANANGRDLSDADVRRFTGIAGNPLSWSMDKAQYLQRVQLVQKLAEDNINLIRQFRGQEPIDFSQTNGAAAAANTAPPPAAAVQQPATFPTRGNSALVPAAQVAAPTFVPMPAQPAAAPVPVQPAPIAQPAPAAVQQPVRAWPPTPAVPPAPPVAQAPVQPAAPVAPAPTAPVVQPAPAAVQQPVPVAQPPVQPAAAPAPVAQTQMAPGTFNPTDPRYADINMANLIQTAHDTGLNGNNLMAAIGQRFNLTPDQVAAILAAQQGINH